MYSWPFSQLTVALALAGELGVSAASTKRGTPLMGWNSYNKYNCNPTEAIIKGNAKGLVDLGLDKLGYTYVTPDCGWMTSTRDASTSQLVWDPKLFPSGGKALGDYIHGLGLKFGLYSGAGYFQCGSENPKLPASLGYESIDAKSFAAWGADSLKYDNCFSVSPTQMVDYNSPIAASPERQRVMASALGNVTRDIVFQVCQWGVGDDVAQTYKPIASSWRISNDIQNNWKSIWRIVNQVVPYYKHTGPGAFPDMDMMIVGLNVLSEEEERFHFGMWAINKSPLILGNQITSKTSTKASSLAILSNADVIAINQDPLAKQAQLVRRYTEEGYDVWAGDLSGGRTVLALANWKSTAQTVRVNLPVVLGITSARARDVWAAKDLGAVSSVYSAALPAHGLHLVVLSDIVRTAAPAHRSAGYYVARDAARAGNSSLMSCAGKGNAAFLPVPCAPAGFKVTLGSVTFANVTAVKAGAKLVALDYVNYDVALGSAWNDGSNSRNLTVSVNDGVARRWAVPISGGSWWETGRLLLELDGFRAGMNKVVLSSSSGPSPDVVGIEVFDEEEGKVLQGA